MLYPDPQCFRGIVLLIQLYILGLKQRCLKSPIGVLCQDLTGFK